MVPTTCPDVPAEVLRPRHTWTDKDAYDRQAAKLKQMFDENYKAYEAGAPGGGAQYPAEPLAA